MELPRKLFDISSIIQVALSFLVIRGILTDNPLKLQIAPLDIRTDEFYTARKSIIESHLQQIQDGMAE